MPDEATWGWIEELGAIAWLIVAIELDFLFWVGVVRLIEAATS